MPQCDMENVIGYDFKKELVRLKVEWIVRSEYFHDQYTSACVQCAGELTQVLKNIMSNEEFEQIAIPIADHERRIWESRCNKKTPQALRMEKFREEWDREDQKQRGAA